MSCADPDNLCTGDPCVIATNLALASPCVVDFGARTLVINGHLRPPDGGVLDLTAGSIQVNADVTGNYPTPGGHGADIHLTATGNLEVLAHVDGSGAATGGTVQLEAGGIVDVERRQYARGGPSGTAGQVIVRGDAGVVVAGDLIAIGGTGGSIEVTSAAGDVFVLEELLPRGRKGPGGPVTLSAQGSVAVSDLIDTFGGTAAGPISITATTGDVTLNAKMRANANSSGTAGGLDVHAGGDVTVRNVISMRGGASTGGISLVGGGAVTIERGRLDARSEQGGTIVLNGASVQVAPFVGVVTSGRTAGGSACISSSTGDVTLSGVFDGRGPGCVIDGDAAGNLVADGSFKCAPSGCIGLSAGGSVSATGSFDTPVGASCPCP